MDRLVTPWRFDYIVSEKPSGCLFCELAKTEPDRESLVLFRGELGFVALNRYPYSVGHLLLAPVRHVAKLSAATSKELEELIRWARESEKILEETYNPDGYNVGFNIGESAGAGVRDHLHLHVVPRWRGDGNFVSTLGETRLLPEELWKTHERLLPQFKAKKDAIQPKRQNNK